MILVIICLVLGIVGLVKRKISVTSNKELRGGPMIAACILLISPLPLTFCLGLLVGLLNAGKPVDQFRGQIIIADIVGTWLPIIAVLIIGFTMGKPKADIRPGSSQQGFDVLPPAPPSR